MLPIAVRSVEQQRTPGWEVRAFVHEDAERQGAWVARNAALELARSWEPDWVGYLDDDDELYAEHCSTLISQADEHGADIVWGWFNIPGGGDPFGPGTSHNGGKGNRGRQYDPAKPHVVPITYLARARYVYAAFDGMGGFQPDKPGSGGVWDVQDMPFLQAMHEDGARSLATSDITWLWHHHGRNTSGMPDKN